MLCENIWRGAILLCLAFLALLPVVSPQADDEDSLVVSSGNVTIAVMAQVNEVTGDRCGDINVYSLQELLAVVWFLDSVNDKGYVPGITIGLEAYRTCRLPSKAAKGAVELLQKNGEGRDPQTDPLLLGLLGPDATTEATVVSSVMGYLPANQRLLLVSGSATGKELADKTLHPSFFRVITGDSVQIKVMQKVLQDLDWNYVAIVYDDDDYGWSAASKLKKLLEVKEMCVPLFAKLPLDTRSLLFEEEAESIADKLNSPENGPIRGLVILASASTTRKLIRTLDTRVSFPQLLLSEAVGLNTATLQAANGQLLSLAAGALLTAPPYIPAPEFEEFWTRLWTNRTLFSLYAERLPWLGDYFVQLTGCSWSADCWAESAELREAQTIRGASQRNLFIGYGVKAAAVMVELLKRLQREKCGAGSSGVCQELSSSIEARVEIQSILQNSSLDLTDLKSVFGALGSERSVRFNSDGELFLDEDNDVEYMVYNLVKGTGDEFSFKQVGEYTQFRLDIHKDQTEFYDDNDNRLTWDKLPHAQCDDNHDCLLCEHDVSGDVMFVEGEFYVLALVEAHETSPDSPLKCGEVRTTAGADVAQAVLMAVNDMNSENTIPGRQVGLVVINTCSSPLYLRHVLTQLSTGSVPLPDGRMASDVLGRVMGVVGADDSDTTMAAYDTLSRLLPRFVQVSGSATAIELSDRRKYPYLLRLVPAADTQALVMLDIVHSLGANYVQVIYDSTTADATGILQRLQEESTSHRYNICIGQSIAVTPSPHTNHYQYIANKLREKRGAKIILTLLPDAEIDKLFTAILPLLTSEDHFRFLGSESWGRRREELAQSRPTLEGSLVLVPDVNPDPAFQRYFTHLDLSQTTNPWLPAFLGCFGNKSFRRKGRVPCPENLVSNEGDEFHYEQDAAVPLSIQSTYALVKGFHAALTQQCGVNASSVCQDLTSQRLVSAMHGVELDVQGAGRESLAFDGGGDGMLGYRVMQVVVSAAGQGDPSGEEGVAYVQVGTWTTTSGLSLRRDELIPLDQGSECPQASEDCGQCHQELPTTAPRPSTPEPDKTTDWLVPVVAGVGSFLIVVIIVLLIALLICCRRGGPKEKTSRPNSSTENLDVALRRYPDGMRSAMPPAAPTEDIATSLRYSPPPVLITPDPRPLPQPRPPPALSAPTPAPRPKPCSVGMDSHGYLKPTPPTSLKFSDRRPSCASAEHDYLELEEVNGMSETKRVLY